jgi:topoisomerase IA-like protein
VHPKNKKEVVVYKSRSGFFLKRGLKRIYLPDNLNLDLLTVEDAVKLLG